MISCTSWMIGFITWCFNICGSSSENVFCTILGTFEGKCWCNKLTLLDAELNRITNDGTLSLLTSIVPGVAGWWKLSSTSCTLTLCLVLIATIIGFRLYGGSLIMLEQGHMNILTQNRLMEQKKGILKIIIKLSKNELPAIKAIFSGKSQP